VTTQAEEAAWTWADTWSRAWAAADVEAICALYAPDARFHSQSLRDHEPPRSYAERVFAQQARAECRFGEPIVSGDRAAVDWWGVIEGRDGGVETIAGTSLLRFAPDGKVVEQRDAWGSAPGRVALPHWAAVR
jgi:ketosteroid isomerase-like protein